jgi:hypothetical protein
MALNLIDTKARTMGMPIYRDTNSDGVLSAMYYVPLNIQGTPYVPYFPNATALYHLQDDEKMQRSAADIQYWDKQIPSNLAAPDAEAMFVIDSVPLNYSGAIGSITVYHAPASTAPANSGGNDTPAPVATTGNKNLLVMGAIGFGALLLLSRGRN